MGNETTIAELKGQTLVSVVGAIEGSKRVTVETSKGTQYAMYHDQDCCEEVAIVEVIGDVNDLIGMPIVEAEHVSNKDNKPHADADSWTWTFYKLGTVKGFVTLRWLGESNGYYSEDVLFVRLPPRYGAGLRTLPT